MPVEMFAFVLLPMVVASGSAMICYVLMNARMEVAVSREKVRRAETEARLKILEETLPQRLQLAADSAEHRALDQLMAGFRVEERRFLRDDPARRRAVILQERLFFRNLPLSSWIEHEMPVFEGAMTPIDHKSAFVAPSLHSPQQQLEAFPKLLTQ